MGMQRFWILGWQNLLKVSAYVYAGLGDKDQAFAWLDKDFQQRNGQLPTIVWRLHFEKLRSDPRYAKLVGQMGLKP